MSFVLAGYVDVEQVGRGGIGDVYRATRASTGAAVAIKVLRDVADSPAAWRRARRELSALVSLAGHPHVVQVQEVLDLDGQPALVMEYLPGGSVGDLLQARGGALTAGEAALIGIQTATALAAAHDHGIVHRDVKPHNLLIDAYGQIKLCDFGVAALARTCDRTTALSMRYASPEDLEDADDGVEIGPSSDVYSLGATLLHLARGAPPTLRDRLVAWVPPVGAPRELAALDEVVARCLRPAPDERPTATELVADLERRACDIELPPELVTEAPPRPLMSPAAAGSDTAATAHRRVAPGRPAAALRRRRVGVPAVAGLALGAVVLVVALVVGRGDSAELAPPSSVGEAAVATAPRDVRLDRPTGLAPLVGATWPLGEIGECLVQVAGEVDLRPIDCARPHDLQRFAAGSLAPDSLGSSGGLEVVVAVRCEEQLGELVDPATLPPDVAIASTRPSADSWAAGDRSYQCVLGVPDRRSIGDLLPEEAIDGGT